MKDMLSSEMAFAEGLAVAKNSKVSWMDTTGKLLERKPEPVFSFRTQPSN